MNHIEILPATAGMQPGKVYLANEGAVNNQFLSEALTQYSVGWTSPEGKLEALLKVLTGEPVNVSKRFEFKKMDNAKAFAAVENDEDVRAIGADFKRVTVQGTTVDAHTLSKGLTLRIDRDELNDDPTAEQTAVAYLKTLLLRGEIIRAFTGLAGAVAIGVHAFGDCPLRSPAVLSLLFVSLAAVPGFLPRSSRNLGLRIGDGEDEEHEHSTKESKK